MAKTTVLLIAEATAPSGEKFVFEIGTDLEIGQAGPRHPPTLRDAWRSPWDEDAICESVDQRTQLRLGPGWVVRMLDWRAVEDFDA